MWMDTPSQWLEWEWGEKQAWESSASQVGYRGNKRPGDDAMRWEGAGEIGSVRKKPGGWGEDLGWHEDMALERQATVVWDTSLM